MWNLTKPWREGCFSPPDESQLAGATRWTRAMGYVHDVSERFLQLRAPGAYRPFGVSSLEDFAAVKND
jgi:hypothetical protein